MHDNKGQLVGSVGEALDFSPEIFSSATPVSPLPSMVINHETAKAAAQGSSPGFGSLKQISSNELGEIAIVLKTMFSRI
ncbi:hypothetical protein [cf. Phormidesmis sp. LEGE 11477]|uniref:hypothetical protein n=1 Tax=cf. Phormidesmis sp. LEGE 11477 TaxID=1828680 RepID=UPI001881D9BC|nr:hypothetical protein [cf. Phormidesmis sp. LEGE 11477]MBE9064983.1 hypothetical protein [cf. Phormidesmis sp. LEGE 11477]